MRILQTIPDLNASSGGTATCTYDLLSAIREEVDSVELLTLDIKKGGQNALGSGEYWINRIPNDAKTTLSISNNLKSALKNSDYDLYHTNGLWLYCNHITCSIARKKKRPYIITPHGMLYPNALNRSYWKKWPLLKLWFEKDIKEASCMHATCKQEMEHIHNFGYNGPIAVIPNLIHVIPETKSLFNKKKEKIISKDCPIIFGFLGRLHPIKKIENILYGAALLNKSISFQISILGKGDNEYEAFLRKEVDKLNLNEKVYFKGFINGLDKFNELANLTALFVPSDSENFGMSVVEALSVGTPVMASLGTPWEDLNDYQCGWWVERSPENIATIMSEIIHTPSNELIAMGERGIQLVNKKYAADKIAKQMLQLYSWILNGGEKPNFVYD